jgi:hypothetical protein
MDHAGDYDFVVSNPVEHNVRPNDQRSDSRGDVWTLYAKGRSARQFSERATDLLLIPIGLFDVPMLRGIDVDALDFGLRAT